MFWPAKNFCLIAKEVSLTEYKVSKKIPQIQQSEWSNQIVWTNVNLDNNYANDAVSNGD